MKYVRSLNREYVVVLSRRDHDRKRPFCSVLSFSRDAKTIPCWCTLNQHIRSSSLQGPTRAPGLLSLLPTTAAPSPSHSFVRCLKFKATVLYWISNRIYRDVAVEEPPSFCGIGTQYM